MTPWGLVTDARQKAGLCRQCNRKRDGKSNNHCEDCRKLLNKQLRQRRQEKILSGLCSVSGCNLKLSSLTLCEYHLRKQNQYKKDFLKRKMQCHASQPTSTTKPSRTSKTPRSN